MDENNVSEALKNKFGEKILEIKVSKRRVFVTVPVGVYKEVIHYLVEELGFDHVQAITGLDTGKFIEVMPHLGRGITVTVRTMVDRDKPMLSTITDIVPGASPHERELHDFLGVVFEGHPNLTRITLPESWPANVFPLRKEYTPEQPKSLREVS
ncbi:MAG: NADH-quinone oxidoreductase subunit C [Nitrososphaerales archaeon]